MTNKIPAKDTTAERKSVKRTPASKGKSKSKRPKPGPTTHKLVWRDITCRVRHTPDYLSKGWSHLEIMVVKPKSAPLPISGTGYRSHFLDVELITKAGGPVVFFERWLDSEATTKAWARADFKWRQGDLFR
jgi:hypothetical protein